MFKLYIMLFVHCAKYDRTFPHSHATATAAAAADRPQPAVPPLHPSHPLRSDPSIALHLILPPRAPIIRRTRGIGPVLIEDVHHAPRRVHRVPTIEPFEG